MPDLFGYDVRDIAKGLKILASLESDKKYAPAIGRLADIISSNSSETETIDFNANDSRGQNVLKQLTGDKFELWDLVILNIYLYWGALNFYWEYWEQFKENGVSNQIQSLLLYIFQSGKYISLKELLTVDCSQEHYQQCQNNMVAFLQGIDQMDQEQILYLYYEIVGAIASARNKKSFYLSILLNNKNFILNLIDIICGENCDNSDWCAHILYSIVVCDKEYDQYLYLLNLLPKLDHYPKTQKYIYKALEIVLKRTKASTTEYKQIQEIAELIKKCKKSTYNTKLLDLLGVDAPYTDRTGDVIKNLTSIGLLNFLSNEYSDETVDGYSLFNENSQLVYLPKFKKLMSKNFVNQFSTANDQQQHGDIQQIPVMKNALKGLLPKIQRLKNPLPSNNNQEIKKDSLMDLAGHIIYIGIEPYQQKNFNKPMKIEEIDKVEDIQQLAGYYGCLVSIREIFMAFADDDPKLAIVLLIDSLSKDKNEISASHMSFLIKKALFKPKLIPGIIEHIDKIQDLGRFLIQEVRNSNLIIDCMRQLGNIDIEAFELENYVKLLNKMINIFISYVQSKNKNIQNDIQNANPDANFKFLGDKFTLIYSALIKTVYSLISNREEQIEVLRPIIHDFLKILRALSELAASQSLKLNQVILPNLENYSVDNTKLELIELVQNCIEQFVPSMAQGSIDNKQLPMAKVDNPIFQKQGLPIHLISNINMFCDLYYAGNWAIAPMNQILLHIKYTDEEVSSKFNFIVNSANYNFDRAEILDYFIEYKINFINSLEPYIEGICDIFNSSNNRIKYLNKFYGSFESNQEQVRSILKKLLQLAGASVEAKFDIAIATIIDLISRCPNLELSNLIMQQLAQLNIADEKKEIISILIKEGVEIPKQYQQLENQITTQTGQNSCQKKVEENFSLDQLDQQQMGERFSSFEEIKIYLVKNFRAISSNNRDIELNYLLAINNLEKTDQTKLLKFFVELIEIRANFIHVVNSTIRAKTISLFNRVDPNYTKQLIGSYDLDTWNIEALYRQPSNKIYLRKKAGIYKFYCTMKTDETLLASTIYNLCVRIPMNSDVDMVKTQTYCVEIMQGRSYKDLQEFKNLILIKSHAEYRDAYGPISGMSRTMQKKERRKAAEFFLECTDKHEPIDLMRFKECCELLLKENIQQPMKNHIENFLIQQPEFIVDMVVYDSFINSLQNDAPTINFNDLQYIYPFAFKKIFSEAKGQIQNYLVIRKYIDPDVMNDVPGYNNFDSIRHAVILSFHPSDKLAYGDDSFANLYNAKFISFFSEYSQYRVLYSTLYAIPVICSAAINGKMQKNGQQIILQRLNMARAIVRHIKKIDFFKYDEPESKLGYWLLVDLCICALLMNKPLFNFDANNTKDAIDLISEILRKIDGEAFKELVDKFDEKSDYGSEKLRFWDVCGETVSLPLIDYIYDMIKKAVPVVVGKYNLRAFKDLKSLHNPGQKKSQLVHCINHCKTLRYIREKFYPGDELQKQDFLAPYYDFSDEEKIIWLLCSLIRQLHADRGNAKKRRLCEEIWETMGFNQLPDNLEQAENPFSAFITPDKLQAISVLLEPALEEPDICKSAKFKNATLINKILKSIFEFLMRHVFCRNNTHTINAIIDRKNSYINRLK